jgi:hypothetical protein
MSATSAEFTLPSLSLSSTLKDSRMLCKSGAGILDRASLDPARASGAGRATGGGVDAGPSNLAAIDAVLTGLAVCCVDVETWRVGELGGSTLVVDPRVFSHDGGCADALLVVDCRRGAGACEGVDASLGFRGELVGVDGRTVEGECVNGELGRRKGEVRGLLKDSGEGLYGVGVVAWDCCSAACMLAQSCWSTYHCVQRLRGGREAGGAAGATRCDVLAGVDVWLGCQFTRQPERLRASEGRSENKAG